jgi:MFS family permease
MAEGGSGAAEAGAESGAASAFLSRDFRLYQTARLLVILGAEAQSIAVARQVYQITRSPLGLSPLALFAPGIFFKLAAGHLADRYDRRWIILTCYSVQAVCMLALRKADALSAESLMQSNMQQSIAEPAD